MQDWEDLRFFLRVADHGSTLAASAICKTSQSTVFRRIGSLEKSLGVQLFDRRASGYVLTEAGSALRPFAQNVEAAILDFREAAIREQQKSLELIRFSAPDVTIEYFLPTVIAEFRANFPDVQIELLASDRKLDLAGGEADVALRSNPLPSETDLFGRCVALDRPLICASRSYADKHPLPTTNDEVATHPFISLTSSLASLLSEWFNQHVPRHRILLQPDSIASSLSAVRSSLGITVLPQFLCDRDPELVAAPLKLPIQNFELWVLSHKRLRKSASVRALMDLIARYMVATTIDRSSSGDAS